MVDITITAWAKTLLHQAQSARDLGLLPNPDSPLVKLALAAEARLAIGVSMQLIATRVYHDFNP
jgi:hypothetical protein